MTRNFTHAHILGVWLNEEAYMIYSYFLVSFSIFRIVSIFPNYLFQVPPSYTGKTQD